MTETYAQFVANLCKSGGSILDSLTPERCHLMHMAIGVSGEAGELADAVKKHVMYGKPLDHANVIEEIGDILFYVTGILNSVNVTLEQVIKHNEEKLKRRYPDKYTDAAAIQRADKQVSNV